MKLRSIKSISALIAILVLITSCASSTVISTVPPGAKVTVNGTYRGVTPYTLTDSKIVGTSNSVQLELEGYQTRNVNIDRTEKIMIGPVIGGLFFFWPALAWCMGYDPIHTYELTPLK